MPFAWYVREKIYSIVLSIHIEYNLELITTYCFPICVVLGRKIFNAKHVGKRTLRAMKVVGMSEEGREDSDFPTGSEKSPSLFICKRGRSDDATGP